MIQVLLVGITVLVGVLLGGWMGEQYAAPTLPRPHPNDIAILETTTVHRGSIHVEAHIVRVGNACQLVWSEHTTTDEGAYPRTTTSWSVACP
jgi:hypothetical protein